ncbi:MAG: hypothetical protein HY337_03105 [Gemmatimonadetes bacterium]|nr:hypothetical protein [Gemmatimonadota bacterium]
MRLRVSPLLIAAFALSCTLPQPAPLPPNTFAFGVFGDGPYEPWESMRFRRVIADANRTPLEWFLHIGDIMWYPCSDEEYRNRLAALNTIEHPVIYTPGDNEWADCFERIAGGYRPLDRLDQLRRTFFAQPGTSIGARRMTVESQAADSTFGTFVENVRWRRGGLLFATVHQVGLVNNTERFRGRTAADDAEQAARMAAALAWLEDAFRIARTDSMHGVVIAFHANPNLERGPDHIPGHEPFVDKIETLAKGFAGQVLLIHGDSHEQRVDQPLRDRSTGAPLTTVTRLETFGSPDIGWVRVVVDSVAGRIVAMEPRLMPRWLLW